MSKYITEFMPEISKAAKRLIRDEVIPAMDSSSSDTSSFELKSCIESLEKESQIMYREDLIEMYRLREYDNVEYIEF